MEKRYFGMYSGFRNSLFMPIHISKADGTKRMEIVEIHDVMGCYKDRKRCSAYYPIPVWLLGESN